MRAETSTRVSDSVFTSVMAAHKLPPMVSSTLSKLLHLDDLDELYTKTITAEDDGRLPFERLFHVLETEVKVSSADLQRIPTTGPVILVANHPFGFVEGCAFAAVLPRIRPDVKIMANSLISVFAGLSDHFLFVNPFGSAAATRENRKGVRAAIEHLRAGGCLVMFPAGEVAHLSIRDRGVVEPAWNPSAAAFARITGASVIPAFFPGSNSKAFHAAGLIHPRLRTALLPREFVNMAGRTIELRIGSSVTAEMLSRFVDDDSATEYIRERASLLRHRISPEPSRATTATVSSVQPLVDAVAPAELSREVQSLSHEHVLRSMQDLSVYSARADEIPYVLREIGRLREITFRQAGEGTGRCIDVDRFDSWYEHLFVWNRVTNEVVGAYRLGRVDEICRTRGLGGLYTNTLFRFDRSFLEKLGGNGCEAGRSFVRLEYQKYYAPLLLLWKGIATWITRNPSYSILFGPVSISNEYTPVSRDLMVTYFTGQECLPEFEAAVKARNPLRTRPRFRNPQLRVWDIEELSAAVADIESDGKGVPVLVRQYLKLGGQLVAFNVDRSFSDVVDGLVIVDLRRTERRTLERYMGRAEAARFLKGVGSEPAYHPELVEV